MISYFGVQPFWPERPCMNRRCIPIKTTTANVPLHPDKPRKKRAKTAGMDIPF